MQGQLGQLLIGVGIFEAGHVAATQLILRCTQLLTPSMGQDAATGAALGLYTAYNVAATLASFPAGRWGDRSGPVRVLAMGVGFFLLAYLGFAIEMPNVLILALCFIAAGIAIGCVETAQHASVASFAPSNLRGSAFGLLAGVQSIANIIASAMGGILGTLLSPTVAFLYLTGWTAISLIVMLKIVASSGRQPATKSS